MQNFRNEYKLSLHNETITKKRIVANESKVTDFDIELYRKFLSILFVIIK